MKTVHLHIGLPKTGTTAIQNSMFAAPEALARHGVHYVRSGTDKFGDRGHHILVMGVLGDRGRYIKPNITEEEIAAAWPLALREIEETDAAHFFLSSELFSFAVIDPEDIARIRDLLKGYRVNVVLVLRDIADFVDSVYAQRLKGGFAGTVEEFVDLNWQNLHWREMTHRWARVFGRVNMKVFDFAALKQGSLVDNFFRKTFGAAYEGNLFPREAMNPALPYYAAQLIREVNASSLPPRVRTDFRIHLRDFFNAHGGGKEFRKAAFLSDDSRTVLRRYCQWPALDD